MIRKAELADLEEVAVMARLLFPKHSLPALTEELSEYILSPQKAIFVFESFGKMVGFAQCSLRYDYVEGTLSSPVGYLEGIFVLPAYRLRKIATELVLTCEIWSRKHGCLEFASDIEIQNDSSQKFHIKLGFKEVNRIINFSKKI